MKYFFELLDSYHRRDCCVSRIDEQDIMQDPRLPKLKDLITKPPAGVQVSPSKKHEGGFTVNAPGVNRAFSVDANGMFIGGTDPSNRKILTQLFGELPDEVGGQQGQSDLTSNSLNPPSPEQVKQLEKDRVDAAKLPSIRTMAKAAKRLLDELRNNAIRRCRIQVGGWLDVTQRNKNSYTPQDREFVQDIYEKVFPEAGGVGKACEALKAIKKRGFKVSDLNIDEKDFERRAASRSAGAALQQINRAIEIGDVAVQQLYEKGDCPRNVKREQCLSLLDLATESSMQDLIAARENLLKYQQWLSGEIELSPDEIEEMRMTVRYTRQGQLIIKGTSLETCIVISDRNRAMFDVFGNLYEIETGRRAIVYDLDNMIKDAGSVASIRGKVDEFMPVIANLVNMLNDAKRSGDDELASELEQTINTVGARIEHLCTYAQEMRKFVAGFENQEFVISEDSLPTFSWMANQTRHTKYCDDISDVLKSTIGYASKRVEEMGSDYVINVGGETGDGKRQDLVYAYNDPEAARQTALSLGIDPDEYVTTVTMRELLELNPEYAKLLPPKALGDLDREVSIILEGVKIETGGDTTYGSLSYQKLIGSMAEGAKLNPTQKLLRDRTRKALGISRSDTKEVDAIQAKLAADIQQSTEAISKLQPTQKVKKGGKDISESGSVVVNNLLAEMAGGMSFDERFESTTLDAGKALAKALDAKPPDTELVEKLKNDFSKAAERDHITAFTEKSFKKDSKGQFIDKKAAMAAADLLARSGNSHMPMVTRATKLKKGGKHQSYRIDHGKATTDCLAAALRGEADIEMNKESKHSLIKVKYMDGGVERIMHYAVRGGSLVASGNANNTRRSALNPTEAAIGAEDQAESKFDRNNPLILETMKFLKLQLNYIKSFTD